MEDCPYLIGHLVLSHIMHIVKQNAIIGGNMAPGGEIPVRVSLLVEGFSKTKKNVLKNI